MSVESNDLDCEKRNFLKNNSIVFILFKGLGYC